MPNILSDISANAGSDNDAWIDVAVLAIRKSASNIQQPEFKQAVIKATETLVAHRDNIANLGVYGLTLFLQKIATGDTDGAYITFIQTQATFQDLIDGQNQDADTIIDAKKRSDEMKARAISIATDLAIDGARILLPFLLALLI